MSEVAGVSGVDDEVQGEHSRKEQGTDGACSKMGTTSRRGSREPVCACFSRLWCMKHIQVGAYLSERDDVRMPAGLVQVDDLPLHVVIYVQPVYQLHSHHWQRNAAAVPRACVFCEVDRSVCAVVHPAQQLVPGARILLCLHTRCKAADARHSVLWGVATRRPTQY